MDLLGFRADCLLLSRQSVELSCPPPARTRASSRLCTPKFIKGIHNVTVEEI